MKTQTNLEDIHPEIRKLAVAWGDAYNMGMIEKMQLGQQIQHVFNLIKDEKEKNS